MRQALQIRLKASLISPASCIQSPLVWINSTKSVAVAESPFREWTPSRHHLAIDQSSHHQFAATARLPLRASPLCSYPSISQIRFGAYRGRTFGLYLLIWS